MLGSAQSAYATYEEEVQADGPFAYFRLNEDGLDAENLGEAADIDLEFAEYHDDVEQQVPGLISTDDDTAARFLGDTGDDTTGIFIPDSEFTNNNPDNVPWEEKSIVLWFQADDANTDEAQMLFEEGGSTRGLNIYVFDGEVIVGAWNRASDGDGSPWISGEDDPDGGNIYVNAPIESGEVYQVALVMEGDPSFDGLEGTLTGYLNGQPFAEESGVGLLYNHGDDTGIGHVHANTYLQEENWDNGNGLYFEGVIDEVALYNTALSADRILAQFNAAGGGGVVALQPGDSDQDLDFDQLDLVQVQIAAKYLTGEAATWGEGDWNGAPGGSQGSPPAGDGKFDQLDIVSALGADQYLKGPYAAKFSAIDKGGDRGDGQTSLVYNRGTGELSVDAPAGKELTSINITSTGNKFIGDKPVSLDGAFDNFGPDNVFKATFGSSFGSIDFGMVLPAGLSEDEVSADLTAVGSLAGGGALGPVDLVYIPEPSALFLLGVALAAITTMVRQRRRR